MSFAIPVLSDSQAAILQQLIDNASALAGEHWGSSAPTVATAGMVWSDTGTGLRKQYDGSTWNILGPICANGALRTLALYQGAIAGGEALYVPASSSKVVVARIGVISTVATVSSTGANNYQFQLRNLTQSLDLFATGPSTNGAELAVDTLWTATPDQNSTITAGNVLRLTVTKNGTPTSLAAARVLLQVDLYPRRT
ncbi:MAG: hypothetical protein IT379_16660 [Deltaproteobacteria bacterium]|nr:hypothetical protein [Deltaproteobacteria bacterium]